MDKFRIICLDGGGLKGIFSITLIKRLAEAVPEFLTDIKLYAGTSTGSITALGLANGLTPEQGIHFYKQHGAKIFQSNRRDSVRHLGKVLGAHYDNRNLKQALTQIFGDTTLKNLADKGHYVLIPTFHLDGLLDGVRTWKPKFFHNFPGEDSDAAERAVDVAIRSSAAPTYFPTYQGYVDGGVMANNPSMAALAQALDPDTGNQPLAAIRMISIGTGKVTEYIAGDRHNWGYAQWARPLVPILLEGSMEVASYQAKRVLGKSRFYRLAPVLSADIALNDATKLDTLIALANKVNLDPVIDWLKNNFI